MRNGAPGLQTRGKIRRSRRVSARRQSFGGLKPADYVVSFLLLLAFAAPAAAQQHEISVGWAHQHAEWHSLTKSPFNGFAVDFATPLPRRQHTPWSIVADFSFTQLSIDADPFERDITLAGGLRWTFIRHGRLTAFAQGLAGVLLWKEILAPTISGTDFIVGAGAGAQFHIVKSLSARAQWHLWADQNNNAWWTMHRLTVSAVWSFGNR